MKRIISAAFVMAVSFFFSAVSVVAADTPSTLYGNENGNFMNLPTKNECLLIARNCTYEADTVQGRVDDLRKEIARGLDVYSPGELKALEEQLKWIESESGNAFM